MNKNVYAKIPNVIMGVNTHTENENGNNIYTNEGSILDIVKDDKVIKILYELIVGTNFRGLCVTSLDDLIINCGYPINKDNKISFTKLLVTMSENGIITLDKTDFKPKDILHIDTDKLVESCQDGYTVLEQKEIDIINEKFSDNRERNTNLKGYLFIKQMVHKRKDNSNKAIVFDASDTQSIVMDYKYIAKFTGIKDITKCIKSLREIDMINYNNFIEYPVGEPQKKMDGKNVYVVRAVEEHWDIELMNEELKLALNQYKNERQAKGFIVAKEYKNNNKSINGLKGKSKEMENKGKDTTKINNKIKAQEVEPKKSNNINKDDSFNSFTTWEEELEEDIINSDDEYCDKIEIKKNNSLYDTDINELIKNGKNPFSNESSEIFA